MCGITGIISFNQNPINIDNLIKMTDEIKYRGPDGEGYLITNQSDVLNKIKASRPLAKVRVEEHSQNLAFGHRRLSILDLNDGAAQPMTDTSGRYWIVFNGEIYNHKELRIELEMLGFVFHTNHSDTEIILNAYSCWGKECLKKLNGMWAFCLWDKQENTFFIARDRAGKKPLYFTEYNHQFFFASELKAILVNKEIPRELDEKSVFDFLTYMMVPSPKTIFKNIYKLPAAHYLFIQPGKSFEPVCYWSPLFEGDYLQISEKEAIRGIKERLFESARLRMLADVEVGVLLSGGLDSSINLACLNTFANKPIKAFSVGFENSSYYKNEFEYSRKVAAYFSADYHELTLTKKDFFDFYSKMVYYQDEPIADTANIPIYYIAKMAGESGVKVLLGGEGSDELFVGYNHWKLARQFSRIFEGRPSLTALMSFIHKNSFVQNKRILYHTLYEKVITGYPSFWSGTELRTEKAKYEILSGSFKERIGTYSSFESIKSLHIEFKKLKGLDTYDWMTAVDLRYRLPDLLLARLDRMLMAASIEGRNPFLDVNLIEYAMKLDPNLKTKNGQEKYILKKAFEGLIPNEIIYRKKDSFSVPLKNLFENSDYKVECLHEIKKFNLNHNVFSEEYISKLSKNNHSNDIWNVSNLAKWFNQFG